MASYFSVPLLFTLLLVNSTSDEVSHRPSIQLDGPYLVIFSSSIRSILSQRPVQGSDAVAPRNDDIK
jgi:hypothetical protein